MIRPDGTTIADLRGREVLVCVCGGIAAYKVCEVVSLLVQRGAGVTVAMTRAARKFVGPTTFEALSGRRVLTSLWTPGEIAEATHIRVTASAHLMLIAPATANTIAKLVCGLANDLVSTLLLAAASPVLLAPSMNDRMWAHPAVKANIETLRSRGCHFVGPGEGWLSCRDVGPGRMAESNDIVNAVTSLLCEEPAPPR